MAALRPADRPDVGDQPVLYVDVTDTDGEPVNPSDGRLLYLPPGADSSVEVPFSSFLVAPGGAVGRVEWQMGVLDRPGLWRVWWELVAAGIEATEPFQFAVDAQTVPEPSP